MCCTLSILAQTPYDNFAPEQSVKSMIELPETQFKVENTNPNSEIRYVQFDKNTMSVNLLNEEGGILKKIQLNPNDKKFTSVDPLAEKKPWMSPYAYCRNNPMRFVDPTGMDEWEIDEYGNIVNRIETDKHDAFYVLNNEGKRIEGQSIIFEYGTIGQFSGTYELKTVEGTESYAFDIYSINGEENAQNLYIFMAEHTSGLNGKQEAEWTLSKFDSGKGNNLNYLTTSHTDGSDVGFSSLTSTSVGNLPLIEMSHSHPGIGYAFPSGLPDYPGTRITGAGDIPNAARRIEKAKANGHPIPNFRIYSPELKREFKYTTNSRYSDFKR